MQFDIAREFVYPQVSLTGLRALPNPNAIRKPARQRGRARRRVPPREGHALAGFGRDSRGFLIARVHWTPDSARLAIERMNRVQNHLDLLHGRRQRRRSSFDSFGIRSLLDQPKRLVHFVGKDEFLWGSERDGFVTCIFTRWKGSSASGSPKAIGK